jgi:hypothetical protein
LSASGDWLFAGSWSPDGKVLLVEDGPRFAILEPDGDRRPRPFASAPGDLYLNWPRLSPNGRWLAYLSDESGAREVYVRPFPGSGSRWAISKDGGDQPVWARNGRELFYRSGDRIMAVEVTSDPTFSVSRPTILFEAKTRGFYDVTPDGQFRPGRGGRVGGTAVADQRGAQLVSGAAAAGGRPIGIDARTVSAL